MIVVNKLGIVLEKRALDFEAEGVLNPAVIYENGKIHLFYRAVAKGNKSTIGYCRFSEPTLMEYQSDGPLVQRESDYESHGVEDPRIVKIGDLYYLSYCAYDGQNAFGCVAISKDMKTFDKQGIVVPKLTGDGIRRALKGKNLNIKYFQPSTGSQYVWDKNLVFFPRRINGKLAFLHRIRPGIQLAMVEELDQLNEQYWEDYMTHFEKQIVLDPRHNHELSYLGNGCPPIETEHGWLLIYHGVHDTIDGYMYVACAALLDLEHPQTEIARLPYALFEPEEEWEMHGYVNYVCFPTGTALIGDTLYIYYGAADERIACASVSMDELLTELLNNKTQHN